MSEPFEFRGCMNLLKSTGRKARSLSDLRDLLKEVSPESVFHHTYQYFLKEHVLEYTNDFAHWAGESLEERSLAEQLSNIDPYGFAEIDALRKEIITVIDEYLARFPEPRGAIKGDEFCFNETVTLVFPVGIRVGNLAEFLMAIKVVDAAAVYYHFYEARIRTKGGVDDFSKWIEDSMGHTGLAERIRGIDPFMSGIERIRGHIEAVVEEEVRKNMETLRVRP